MKRGDVWTAAGGRDDAGKPSPVVIIEDDRFDATASITICAFNSDATDAPLGVSWSTRSLRRRRKSSRSAWGVLPTKTSSG
jgi:mRNA-degrading endonuclease toxin of MazEF toxin-antitoxin module